MFCDREFFDRFGKKGTESDIILRNHADSAGVVTFVHPLTERIQPVLQAAAMCDYPIIVVNEINQNVGETCILLDALHCKNGLIVTELPEDQLRSMVKGTSIEGFDVVHKNENAVWEKIRTVNVEKREQPALVTIDAFFDVKGVGTVLLGLVKSGTVRQYDKLICFPPKKETLIKSMQSQDKDVKETEPGQRIGMAVKGVEIAELRRGYVLSNEDIPCSDRLNITVHTSKYSKYELSMGKQILIAVGQQVVSGTVQAIEGANILVALEKPVAVHVNECIVATNDKMPRIIGSGKLAIA